MKAILAAAALTLSAAIPASALDLSAMNEDEKKAFGEAVREYLMANPEVLLESINVLEVRRAEQEVENDKQLVANFQKELFEDGHSWVGGNPDGDLTIVEFMDYKCVYCRRVMPDVTSAVEADGNIRFIVKEFPILGTSETSESRMGARFAIATQQVAGDEAYETIHNALMTTEEPLNLVTLRKIAEDNKLDAKAIIDRMNTEDVTAVLRANAQLAQSMGIQGTPTFVIGTELLRGVPPQGIAEVVKQVRANKAE